MDDSKTQAVVEPIVNQSLDGFDAFLERALDAVRRG
jgi:hypothetical protein